MKRNVIMVLTSLLVLMLISPALRADIQNEEKAGKTQDDKVSVTVGKNLLKIRQGDSSVHIDIKNRGIEILESLEGTKVKFEKYSDTLTAAEANETPCFNCDQDDREERRHERWNRFRGHWAGIEFGVNGYVTSDQKFSLPPEIDYMTLHSGRSFNFNINFSQLNIGLTRHIGFVTGLGLNINNYRFDGNNNIMKGPDGVIEILDPGVNLKKSKLATYYLTLPFMLEVQIPVTGNHFNLTAGPIGAVKIFSQSKMIFEDNKKEKSSSDFSLNLLRYGWTGRIGYGNFQVFGTYYITPLFQAGKGPAGYDLHPFEIGLACTFND